MGEASPTIGKSHHLVSLITMADQWLQGGCTHEAAITYTKAYALDLLHTRTHFRTLPKPALQAIICTFEDWCICCENSKNLLMGFDIPISVEQLCDFVTSDELSPKSKVAWSLKVKMLMKRENYTGVVTACTAAIERIAILDTFFLVSRGLASIFLCKSDNAIRDYLSAFDFNPDLVKSCVLECQSEHIDTILQYFYQTVAKLEGQEHVNDEDRVLLVKLYKFILKFTPMNILAYESCAGHLTRLGKFKDAVVLLSDGLRDKGELDSLQLLLQRSLCYLATDDHDLALNDYATAVSINEDITKAAISGLSHQQQGKLSMLANQLASDLLSHHRIKSKLNVPCSVDIQISRNQLKRAAALYRLLYLTDNTNIEALLHSAECLKLQRKETEAIQVYTLALSLRPRSPKTHSARALCHIDSGDIHNAINDFSKALELQPDNVEALCGRGYSFLVCNELNNALSDFAKASKLSMSTCSRWAQELSDERSERLKKHFKECLTFMLTKGKPIKDIALQIGDLSTRLFPEDLECHLAYVEILMLLRKSEEATAVLVRLIQNSPENHLHNVHLASLKVRQGKIASGLEDLRTILRTIGEKQLSDLLFKLSEGERCRIKKEAELEGEHLTKISSCPNDTVDCYSIAIAASPNTACEAYMKRAISYAKQEKNKEALAGFGFVLKLNPKSVEAYCARGLIHALCSNFRESYRDFLKALVLDIKSLKTFINSLSDHQRPVALGTLEDCAQILFSHYISNGNKSPRMLSLCRLLVSSDPNVASYHSMYADGLIIHEDYSTAIKELETARKLCPDDMSVFGRSALVYVKLNKINLATAEFSRMAEADLEGLRFMLQALNSSQKVVLQQEAITQAEHLSRISQYEQALPFYHVAVAALEGKDQDSLRMRSRCFERLQRYGLAVDDMSAVISLGKPLIGDICARANLHILDDNLRCACQDFLSAFQMNETVALNFVSCRPGKEALVKIFTKAAIEAYDSKNYFEATKNCNCGLKLDPSNSEMKHMKMKIDFGLTKCVIQ